MYKMHWITSHLATGHAPMSYQDLDEIRSQGISAIINLCGEFCDLHEIEESSGFDVFYLPIVDECAPDKEAMEKGLDWLDEAIYLNKKVLVHCRMGHGRTGTFIAAYLLRRGFDFKGAQKTMKGRNANPATFAQRRFLKKYGKEEGVLKTSTPKIDSSRGQESADGLILKEYAQVLHRFDEQILGSPLAAETVPQPNCCTSPFYLQLIESMHLSEELNRVLRLQKRQNVLGRALALSATMKEMGLSADTTAVCAAASGGGQENSPDLVCPLLEEGQCLAGEIRPARCRYWGREMDQMQSTMLADETSQLSRKIFTVLTGQGLPGNDLRFSLADSVTGKYVQLCFQALSARKQAAALASLEAADQAGQE